MKEFFSRAYICGVQESHVTSSSIYSQARLRGMAADHPSTHTHTVDMDPLFISAPCQRVLPGHTMRE